MIDTNREHSKSKIASTISNEESKEIKTDKVSNNKYIKSKFFNTVGSKERYKQYKVIDIYKDNSGDILNDITDD